MSQSSVLHFRSPVAVAIKWVFVVVTILAAAWAVQVMSSAMLRVRGDHAVASGDRTRAEKLYKMAMSIDPQNWPASFGLGQVYSFYRYQELDPVAKKTWALLERDTFAKAYRHNDKKEEVTYGLGRAQLMAGESEAGLNNLRKAAERKRFNDFYWRKLGVELRKAGHYTEAMDAFLYAQKLNSHNDTVNHNIKWLKAQMSKN